MRASPVRNEARQPAPPSSVTSEADGRATQERRASSRRALASYA